MFPFKFEKLIYRKLKHKYTVWKIKYNSNIIIEIVK